MSHKPPLPDGHVTAHMMLRLITVVLLIIHDAFEGFSYFTLLIIVLILVGAWLEWADTIRSDHWFWEFHREHDAEIKRQEQAKSQKAVQDETP